MEIIRGGVATRKDLDRLARRIHRPFRAERGPLQRARSGRRGGGDDRELPQGALGSHAGPSLIRIWRAACCSTAATSPHFTLTTDDLLLEGM